MCVVALDAASQPDYFFYAKIIRKILLDIALRESGIALLHLAKKTLFGGQHETLAIHVNAAALKYDLVRLAVAVDGRSKLLQLELLGDALRKLVVMLPVGILGPCVEAPVG